MLQLMFIIFLVAGKYSHYKAECSSHHAENTFLCMRLNPRGLTPSMTGMDDKQGNEKGEKVEKIARGDAVVVTADEINLKMFLSPVKIKQEVF